MGTIVSGIAWLVLASLAVAAPTSVATASVATHGASRERHKSIRMLVATPDLGSGSELRAYNYLAETTHGFVSPHSACVRPEASSQGKPQMSRAATPRVLLAAFAALSKRSRTSAPRMPELGAGDKVFVRGVRVSQTQMGSVLKLVPVELRYVGPVGRCLKRETRALRSRARKAPTAIRVAAERLANEELADQRYVRKHHAGLCVHGLPDVSFCQNLIYIRARGAISIGSAGAQDLTAYLVPNGVTRVVVRYPPTGYGNNRVSPPLAVRARVINNVAAWQIRGEPGANTPTITWYGRDGAKIRDVTPLWY